MGCWDATCGISQLPIHADDEVVLIFIQKQSVQSAGSDSCYPDDVWKVISFPVFGKYDDYGGMNLHEDQYLIQLHNADIIQSRIHDSVESTIKNQLTDFDKLQEYLHDDQLLADDTRGDGVVPIGRMMFHRKIWDELVNRAPMVCWDKTIRDHAFYIALLMKEAEDVTRPIWSSIDQDLMGWSNHQFEIMVSQIIHQHKATAVNNEMTPATIQLIDQMAQMYVFNNAFCNMRHTYHPQTGAGSQDSESKMYHVLMDAMKSVLDDSAKRFGEDEDEDE